MDRFESLTAFVAVVEAGGFTAASRRLGVPLASVSRKVSDLEAMLKVKLLQRTTRRMSLTESGRTFFESSRRILDELREAERLAAGEYQSATGTLTVSAPVVAGRIHLVPIAAAFLARYREVNLKLLLNDRFANLVEEEIDVALRIGDLADSTLVATEIGRVRAVVCASPAYLAVRGVPNVPSELSQHDCIGFSGLAAGPEWPFVIAGKSAAVPVPIRLLVTTAEAAIDAACEGIGITRVLSYQAAEAIRSGRLTRILGDFERPTIPVCLVFPSGRLIAAKLRAFLDFAIPRLRAALQSAE